MVNHPCKYGPGGMPCNRYRRGEVYDISQDCRLCWLFAHDLRYNLAWGGGGEVISAPSAVVETKTATPKPLLLGDAIKKALDWAGVTQERVARWFGSCFGCPAKQKALNDLHQWARDTENKPVEVALDLLAKLIGE